MAGQSRDDEIERLRKDLDQAIGHLTKIRQDFSALKTEHDTLLDEHKQRKAIKGFLSWLIDKSPTIAAICVFFYWVVGEASKKVGGNGH